MLVLSVIGFILLYLVYVTVVILGRIIYPEMEEEVAGYWRYTK